MKTKITDRSMYHCVYQAIIEANNAGLNNHQLRNEEIGELMKKTGLV